MKKKVMIFYFSKYSGHHQAAKAIEQGLLALSDDIEVTKINALTYTNPILGKIINKAYIEIIKKKPEVWDHIYDNPDVMKKTKRAREVLHKFNMSKIKKLIEKYSPDIVYCTQAFPCGMVADYKKSSKSDITLVGVLTDHAPHSYWLNDEVDYYVAPSEKTARILEGKGVEGERIKVYGIPVDPKFRKRHYDARIFSECGFSKENPTILIMGGSQGLGAVEECVKSLLADKDHNYQLLVVTGSNKKLYNRLNRKAKKNRSLKVFPYVENIDELMEISDLIISKAGGMTTAEASVKGSPMMIFKPIPGHERMNTDYLVGEGAAVEVTDCAQLHKRINELFDLPGALEVMKEKMKALASPDSALKAAELTFRK